MVTTRPPKTIVEPTALGPVANTDAKLLIYRLFQKGRVLAQDGVRSLSRGSVVPRGGGSLDLGKKVDQVLAQDELRILGLELGFVFLNEGADVVCHLE